MIKNLYHGSEFVIKSPQFGVGRTDNDYGRGFYCTERLELAKEWAVADLHDGHANRYTLDFEGLTVIDLDNQRRYTPLHWLAVLLENREFDLGYGIASEVRKYILENFKVDYSSADVMTGYRADDSYFTFARDFLSGVISYSQLVRALRLGKLGTQVVLKSERAFNRLHFEGEELALKTEWLSRKQERDQAARSAYFDSRRNPIGRGELMAFQIWQEEVKPNDPRLFR